MDALSRLRCLTACHSFQFQNQLPRISTSSHSKTTFPFTSSTATVVLRATSTPVTGVDDDVVQIFLKERELNGDFISRASDILWRRNLKDPTASDMGRNSDTSLQVQEVMESSTDEGFLKLSRTKEWVLGGNSAPINMKATAKELQDDKAKKKKLNILRYESLKRELLLLSVGIGAGCSGYCLVAFSIQAAVSYAVGVLFSCLYLQLLYRYADNISREDVPEIFKQKKSKRIGIRSEDLKNALERSIKGSGMSLSSPRLVIPAAIYGLWVLNHQYLANNFFDFELVPAMLGMFVYKAAVLVQVYRDNEDLRFVFPDDENDTSN